MALMWGTRQRSRSCKEDKRERLVRSFGLERGGREGGSKSFVIVAIIFDSSIIAFAANAAAAAGRFDDLGG